MESVRNHPEFYLPGQWERILEPLTDRQLAACLRQVRWDRHEHIRAKHSRNEFLAWHVVYFLERIAETAPISEHQRRFFEAYSGEPLKPERDPLFEATPERHDLFMTAVAYAVSEYWSHATDLVRTRGGPSGLPGLRGRRPNEPVGPQS